MYYILPPKTDRKMCVVLQHILARGPLRAPVASPSPWLFQGIEPVPEPADRIAGQSLAGDFALPAPIDHGAIAPPEPTRRTWRYASPPAPHHARTSGRPITNQGSVPAAPDTPWPLHGDDFIETMEGSFRATLALDPTHRAGAFAPLASLTNLPQVGRAVPVDSTIPNAFSP